MATRTEVREFPWPDDTNEIDREIATEELVFANTVFEEVRKNWSKDEEE